jgi:hypothetical protein
MHPGPNCHHRSRCARVAEGRKTGPEFFSCSYTRADQRQPVLIQQWMVAKLMLMVMVPWVAGVVATSGGGPLLPCGTHHDFLMDGQQLMGHFQFAKAVCCDQLGETCVGNNPLPQSCLSSTCARAVRLVSDSCSALFEEDYFQVMALAYKPLLDNAMALCDIAAADRQDAGTTDQVRFLHARASVYEVPCAVCLKVKCDCCECVLSLARSATRSLTARTTTVATSCPFLHRAADG